MVVFALGIMSNLEYRRAKAASAPSDCTKLFRIVTLLVNQIHLIEDLLHFPEVNAVFLFDVPTLAAIKLKAHFCITVIPPIARNRP